MAQRGKGEAWGTTTTTKADAAAPVALPASSGYHLPKSRSRGEITLSPHRGQQAVSTTTTTTATTAAEEKQLPGGVASVHPSEGDPTTAGRSATPPATSTRHTRSQTSSGPAPQNNELSSRNNNINGSGEAPFDSSGSVELISNLEGGIRRSRQLPYVRIVVAWNVALAVAFGTAMFILERTGGSGATYVECVFLALNACTATGLAPFDVTEMRPASLYLLAACMQLGAATLLSLFPVVLRIHALEAALPRLHVEHSTSTSSDRAASADAPDAASNGRRISSLRRGSSSSSRARQPATEPLLPERAAERADDDVEAGSRGPAEAGPGHTTTTSQQSVAADEQQGASLSSTRDSVSSSPRTRRRRRSSRNNRKGFWRLFRRKMLGSIAVCRARWRRHRKLVTFDLRKYRLVPQWLVEYKALCFLLRIVLAYHVVVYLIYGSLLALYLKCDAQARRVSSKDVEGTTPASWAAFTVVSAFNNVGFTLQKSAFVEFGHTAPVVLVLVGALVLHGNVLFPACIRWGIVWLSAASARHSNRKVYFRYLLLHGRKLYSSLFSSQANWLLVATQLALISTQISVTLFVSRNDPGFKSRSSGHKLNIAAFEAVNSRHAGISAVDLKTLHGATLVLILAMMWLAPAPFVVALRSSAPPQRAPPGNGGASLSSPSGHVLLESGRGVLPPHPQHQQQSGAHDTYGGQSSSITQPGTLSASSSASRQDPFDAGENSALSRRRRHSIGREISAAFAHHDDDASNNTGVSPAWWAASHHSEAEEDDEYRGGAGGDQNNNNNRQHPGISNPGMSSAARGARNNKPVPRVPDAMVDTRALLLERYPESSPPWTARVSARLDAFAYHVARGVRDAYVSSGFARDAACIFAALFLIACLENFRVKGRDAKEAADTTDAKSEPSREDPSHGVFYALFELVSAFGNVGLSLGSLENPDLNVAFSHDLCVGSLLVLGVVMIGARTRSLPRRVDASLAYTDMRAQDVLRCPVVTARDGSLNLLSFDDNDDDDDDFDDDDDSVRVGQPLNAAAPSGVSPQTLTRTTTTDGDRAAASVAPHQRTLLDSPSSSSSSSDGSARRASAASGIV